MSAEQALHQYREVIAIGATVLVDIRLANGLLDFERRRPDGNFASAVKGGDTKPVLARSAVARRELQIGRAVCVVLQDGPGKSVQSSLVRIPKRVPLHMKRDGVSIRIMRMEWDMGNLPL